MKTLRIDPAMDACAVKILEITCNGETVPPDKKKTISVNGRAAKAGTYIFPMEDPNINIAMSNLQRNAENTLYIRMEIVRLPHDMAQDMAGSVKRIL